MHGFMNMPDVKVYVLSNNPWVQARFSRQCQKFFYRPNSRDPVERLAAVAEIVKKTGVKALLPVGIDWIEFAGVNRAALSQVIAVAPVPEPEAFKTANNKWLLSQFMQASGVAGPPTILGELNADFECKLQGMRFPILVKPYMAWGGEGIRRFDTIAEFEAFLTEYGRECFNNRYIIQTFLNGYVVGLNILCKEGKILAHTMQRGIIPNTQKWAAAAAIQFVRQEGVLETAQKLLTALNWSGFGNLDMFFDTDDNQVKILEVNSRFWGSLRGSYVAGVNFPYLACLAALNIPFDSPTYQLAQYVHPKTALKMSLSKLLGKNQKEFAFNETGLKYLLRDPLAEAARALYQATAGDKWQ
jgi:predicted ATP-grasp superfamily ATP-dependent carboligase